MIKSIWQNSVNLPEFETLEGNKSTDILIIGGGMAGLLCGYMLTKAGIDCTIAEGNRIASGITKNTTAKITSLHSLVYDKLIRGYGKHQAQGYLLANEDAIKSYKSLCEDIDCDYETKTTFTYSLSDRYKIEREARALDSLGAPAGFTKKTELPFDIAGSVYLENQAQFNPLKFIAHISKDLHIYENTFIRDITPHRAVADKGKMTAKKIIVTTHFPFINKHGSYFLKLYQHRSYVLALENAQKIEGMYVDEDEKGLSFRRHGNLLLLGGGGHRTGKKGGNYTELEKFAKCYYNGSTEITRWATQDCMTLDNIPYIGQYSKRTPDLFVATGFNKWGMTSSMAAAAILTDLVQEKKNKYAEVFSPSRSILKPQLFVNAIETLTNFIYPTANRCPHLGCALKWNKAEHSLDCPCHGSRFDEDGTLVDNPATGDAEVK